MSLLRRACTCCRPLAASQSTSAGAARFSTSASSNTPASSTPGGSGPPSSQTPRPPRPPHTQRKMGVGKPQPGKAHQQRHIPTLRNLSAPESDRRAAFSPGSTPGAYGTKPRGERTRWGEGPRGDRQPAAGFEYPRPAPGRYGGDSSDRPREFGARKPGGLYGGSREPRSGGFGQRGEGRQTDGREGGGYRENARRDQPREGRFGIDPSRTGPRRDMGQINDRSRLRRDGGELAGFIEPAETTPNGAEASTEDTAAGYDETEGASSSSRSRPAGRGAGPPSRDGGGEKSSRSYRAIQAEGGRDGFVLSRGRDRPKEEKERGRGKDRDAMNADRIKAEKRQKEVKVVDLKVEKKVFVPSSVSVGRLADIFGVKIFNLQRTMQRLGLTEDQRRSDYLLTSEEACNIALEYGLDPTVDDERTFDIFPEPDQEGVVQPLRPPVVTIMVRPSSPTSHDTDDQGHVDHGKTTLLDSLRHSSVATGEAGGITQHIGAFSVPLSSLLPSSPTSSDTPGTITFLDTPGHAAFTAMRARGASVTDMIVLVVAADDGVMPQTREVIELWKSDQDKVGLVVAINKCDKAGIDFDKIKSALGAEGILLEEDGGDVPSVRVSGLKGEGLDKLVETLSTLAEIRELRARSEGKAEGYILESRVDRGQGNVATVLVSKGTLTAGTCIVAGTTWARVRQMQDSAGRSIKSAPPGTPVSIMGWREIPHAGDQLLEAASEDEAKKAIVNRLREIENRKLLSDVESINIKRVAERKKLEKEEEEVQRLKEEGKTEAEIQAWKREFERTDGKEEEGGRKELRLVIKGDVSGSVEAVVGSLEGIGNKEAGVKIVHVGVGEVGESDIRMAEAAGAFSVPTSKSNQTLARTLSVPHHADTVIYRLIETVRSEVIKLLPKVYESRVSGEATCQAIFEIKLKGKEVVRIAGCKVSNGVIESKEGVGIRVLRGPERTQVYEGTIETLKHLKKDVTEVRKGTECGISFHGFTDVKEGDEIIAFTKFEVPRHL